MALIIYHPLFWAAGLFFLGVLGLIALRKQLHWWPAYVFRLLLALAVLPPVFLSGETWRSPAYPSREVMLLDESRSVPDGIQEQNRQKALDWLKAAPNRVLVPFGAQPFVVSNPTGPWPDIDGRATNLSAALDTAAHLLSGSPGRVVVISDGLASDAAAVDASARALKDAGSSIQVVPFEAPSGLDDLSVNWLWAPGYLWENSDFQVTVQVNMPRVDQVEIELDMNGKLYDRKPVNLSAGLQTLYIPVHAGTRGVVSLAVHARLEGDANPNNNDAYTTAQVYASPAVLVVSNDLRVTSSFPQLLKKTGIRVNVVSPDVFPVDMPTLEQYQVIFLDNLLANDLSLEQVSALKLFISKLGKGAVFLGGRSAYTLGGYKNSPLESMLPVQMEPPDRKSRAPVTFVLLIDASGSMGYSESPDQAPPISLAKEAALRVIETMRVDDTLGIASYSDDTSWNLPPGRVGDGLSLRLAIDSVSHLNSRSGTQMYKALSQVVDALGSGGEGRRYILLLSDGKSADGSPADFQALAERAASMGDTISTIALGQEPDRELMALIAQYGNGRLYIVPDARLLPQVMVSESRAATGDNIQPGEVGLQAGFRSHPVLAGLDLSTFPALTGYNALKSRSSQGAEDILLSASFGDPVLSSWQYGLGRVMAWTGDAGQEWNSSWLNWVDAGRFWTQVVRYALPDPALGEHQLDIRVSDTSLSVGADLNDLNGLPLNLLKPEFEYIDLAGKSQTFSLPQVAPGRYALELPRPDPGAYRGAIRYVYNGNTVELPASFSVNTPSEERPGNLKAARAALLAWAGGPGGDEVKETTWETLPAAPGLQPLASPMEKMPFWWLPALVVFWLVEIALRRRWLPWR